MLALGKFADTDLARTGVLSGGEWSADLPLTNLQTGARFVEQPARCEDCTDLANSQFVHTLANPSTINLVGLLFHTMSLAARFQITGKSPGVAWEDPAFSTGWMDVYGRLYDSHELPWESENWWTGTVTSAEIDLYRRHRFVTFSDQLVEAIRVEFDDADHPDETFDLGHLWISGVFSPSANFERGRDLALDSRSLQDEAPSGRLFTEERPARRTLNVPWQGLTTTEARRMFDAAARAGIGRMVIFIPDSDDEPGTLREAFPAVFARPPAVRFNYPTINPVAATFREILA